MKDECPVCGKEYELKDKHLLASYEDFHGAPVYSFVCPNCSHVLTKKGIEFKLNYEKTSRGCS